MRRPRTQKPGQLDNYIQTGDIKKDLTEKQLAAIGAAAIAYNRLEDQIDELLLVITRTPTWLFSEVSSRINGLEGKVQIIYAAIDDLISIFPDLAKFVDHLRDLRTVVGEFMRMKGIRDAIMHARIIDAAIGIGKTEKKRGKSSYEILLSVKALDAYYNQVVALENALIVGGSLLSSVIALSEQRDNDLYKPQLLSLAESDSIQFQNRLRYLQSLPPMPQFPDEDEIQAAVDRWYAVRRAQKAD